MIVETKLSQRSRRIESLTLIANTPEDYELLSALYGDYTQRGGIEVILRNSRCLNSAITERRRSPRTARSIPVLLLWEKDGQEQREQTFTLNVSRFGCAIQSQSFFAPKTRIRLRSQGKIIEGQTVYSLSDYSRRLVEVGIDFGRDAGDFWAIAFPDE